MRSRVVGSGALLLARGLAPGASEAALASEASD